MNFIESQIEILQGKIRENLRENNVRNSNIINLRNRAEILRASNPRQQQIRNSVFSQAAAIDNQAINLEKEFKEFQQKIAVENKLFLEQIEKLKLELQTNLTQKKEEETRIIEIDTGIKTMSKPKTVQIENNALRNAFIIGGLLLVT